jgi:acetate kinase
MLNESHNAETLGAISTDASRATVRVIRMDEELMIARSLCRALELGMASENRNSGHATKYISRLDPFSAGGVPS